MSNFGEKPTSGEQIEAQHTNVDSFHNESEKVDYDRGGAIEAEKLEHNMSVLEAVKTYPAASWWAFVMSATIVSSYPQTPRYFH